MQHVANDKFKCEFRRQTINTDFDDLPESVVSRLYVHWKELSAWNEKINLTAIRDMDEAISRHYLDSLELLGALDGVNSMLDIGSGAGFPGMVIASARPDLEVHLVESIGKKAHFLNHAKRQMELSNLHVHNARIEQLGLLKKFDLVTGRAAAHPEKLAELAKPWLAEGGKLAIFCKSDAPQEIEGWKRMREPGGGSREDKRVNEIRLYALCL